MAKRGRKPLQPPADFAEIIAQVAKDSGALETHAAEAFGVCWRVFRRWLDENEDFAKAWAKAKTVEHDELVDTLRELAVKDKNVTALIFALKARHGYRDGGPGQVDPEAPQDRAKKIKATLEAMDGATVTVEMG